MRPPAPVALALILAAAAVPASPAGFAPLPREAPAPLDNPTTPGKVALGRMLFFDGRLSGDLSSPCSSCHNPALGWGDGAPISHGYPGTIHWRNSQTIVNSGFYPKLFWQGNSLSLEAQATAAATGNLGGNVDKVMAEERLAQVPEYMRLFREVFGVERPTFGLAMKAIAAFERTIVSWDTPFDSWLRGEAELPADARRGMALFVGRAGCAACHGGPLLTDDSYHDLGVPDSPVFAVSPLHQVTLRYQHFAKGATEEGYRNAHTDWGLYYTTKRTEDKGKFRTPGLRYIAYTAPYMHNGAFRTLAEVVDFYDAGGGEGVHNSRHLRPLGLTAAEKADMLAFLATLSGDAILVAAPDLPPYAPTEE